MSFTNRCRYTLFLVLTLLLLGGPALPAASAAKAKPKARPKPKIVPDLPRTESRFGWLRHEHQKPKERSPRPRSKQTNPFRNNFDSLRLAIEDLTKTFGPKYPNGKKYLARLAKLEKAVKETQSPLKPLADEFDKLLAEALLANPLIDFDKLLFVDSSNAMTPRNWLSLDSVGGSTGRGVALKVLSPVAPDGKITTLFVPPAKRNLIAIDLHWDAKKLLYTATGLTNRGHQLFEVDMPPKTDPKTKLPVVREIETIADKEVSNYDACYSPDDSIIFVSTATMNGVPCIRGKSPIGNLYRRKTSGAIDRLTNDQDHDWHPTVLANGRIMYLRWDYTDTPHAFNRIMFSMNPDGTGQAAMYGSNSYWPNCMFYPKAVPGSSTKFIGSIVGHHSGTIGGMFLFDTARGTFEADGVVQQVPGYKKPVFARIADGLGYRDPKITSSHPLSDKYFLTACWPGSNWNGKTQGIYLMDVFDNGLELCSVEGRVLLEPTPWKKRTRPPVIPDKTDPKATTGTVVLNNVYFGRGTKGVPKGTIKSLRIYSYNYAMRRMGGQSDRVGMDGPWDVRVIHGTVPVEDDGSANFTVPAMTPLAIQPLDAEGKAVQLMRSWFTCRPGEVLSCIGCHEDPNTVPEPKIVKAAKRQPSKITPWYGPVRGFSFNREVQPALDKYCISCHNAKTTVKDSSGRAIANLTLRPDIVVRGHGAFRKTKSPPQTLVQQIDAPLLYKDQMAQSKGKIYGGMHFSPAYLELFRFARSATLESDLHLLTPYDYHADQTKLVQMLKKGHHGVRLDKEAWDRIITWIDLNTPAHGTWQEVTKPEYPQSYGKKRAELMKKYGGIDFDPETAFVLPKEGAVRAKIQGVDPMKVSRSASIRAKFPSKADAKSLAGARDSTSGKLRELTFDLSKEKATLEAKYAAIKDPRKRPRVNPKTLNMTFVRIPAGSYVTGNVSGAEDEMIERKVTVDKPFWIASRETTNELFNLFDPTHDSRLDSNERLHFGDGTVRGFPLNKPLQPVVRISQAQALGFCKWLSAKTGKKCTLPSEAQWEWAAVFGKCDENGFAGKDFSKLANLADKSYLTKYANGEMPLWRPSVLNSEDGARVSTEVGKYAPNAAGVYDMIGNVAEWTTTAWKAPKGATAPPQLVAKGGGWRDRPKTATPFSKMPARGEIKFVDVGFRVIIED
ncbi:MAG: SUMF1/EgtB/PvdO family nonheme iron enzyme [Phycisphaerae bacterium]|jgi:formylglycine-generating enzyme required for sulfatase activity|nr:SUMF1/EgtB/PvdO family nonheme iron enzyme [Phycisphaerae bacterium]